MDIMKLTVGEFLEFAKQFESAKQEVENALFPKLVVALPISKPGSNKIDAIKAYRENVFPVPDLKATKELIENGHYKVQQGSKLHHLLSRAGVEFFTEIK